MSTIDINEPKVEPTVPNRHTDAAQERINELRRWREEIPHFVIPPTADAMRRLASAASVSAEFVELTNVAVANQTSLVRAEGLPPAEVRDLVSYADAYDPLADELEAAALFIRHSTLAARNKAGTEALTTYALAQRMAKRPENAGLKPHVADMRRALGRGRKPSPEARAQKAEAEAAKAAEQAAKAAERAAKAAAKVPKTAVTPPADAPTPQPS